MPRHRKLARLLRARSVRHDTLEHHRQMLDGLAHRVFTPTLKRKEALHFYVTSSVNDEARYRDSLVSANHCEEAYLRELYARKAGEGDGTIEAEPEGPFETALLGKLRLGEKNLIALIGDIGCGKSFVSDYLLRGPIDKLPHCTSPCNAGKVRVALKFDFTHDLALAALAKPGKMTGEIRAELMDEVCERIRDCLADSVGLVDEEEFLDFWEQEFQGLRGAFYDSSVFVRLRNRLRRLNKDLKTEWDDIATRQQALDEITSNTQLRFEYCARLWGYALISKHNGRFPCQLLIFDNVDALDASVQSALLGVLLSLAETSRSVVVLLLRPESLARRHKNTRVMDVVSHSGATPTDIVIDRLRRFVSDPNSFFKEEDGLPQDEFERVLNFCIHLYSEMDNSPSHPLRELIASLSGFDVRNALIFAQEIIKIDPEVRDIPSLSSGRITRELLRGGGPYYSTENQPFVDNLFCTIDEVGWNRPLIKLRIITQVCVRPRHRTSIDDILQKMVSFGYSDVEITAALNDLLDPRRQLLRSNGRDFYQPSELAERGGDIAMITAMGKGYAQHLYADLDYVQEVMYDTAIDEQHFGTPLLDQTVQDRLRLVSGFLHFLFYIDREETATFLRLGNVLEYREAFPDGLLTLRMAQNAADSIRAITSAMETDRAEDPDTTVEEYQSFSKEMADLRKLFTDLVGDAERLNGRLMA